MTMTIHAADVPAQEAGRVERLIMADGYLIDQRRWDDWLSLYSPDCAIWAPAWIDSVTPGSDPHAHLSHFFLNGRDSLRERINRLMGGHSPASVPLPRTTHLKSAIRKVVAESGGVVYAGNWQTHIYHPRDRTTQALFGEAIYEVALQGDTARIRKKKVVINNDYIASMLDFYCI